MPPQANAKIYFPYNEVRNEQSELMKEVMGAIREKKHLLAHAPTGLGKCCVFETPVLTEKGLCQIGAMVEEALGKNRVVTDNGVYSVPLNESFVWAFNPSNGGIEKAKIKAFYKKEKCKNLLRVKTFLGKEVVVTPEHPLFSLNGFEFDSVPASEFREGDFIVCPNKVSFGNTCDAVPLNAYSGLNANLKRGFGKRIKKLLIEELKFNPKQVMRYWRLSKNMTCKARACELKVNFHTYSGWEHTKYGVPSEILLKLGESIKKDRLKKISVDFLIKLVKEKKMGAAECRESIFSFGHFFPTEREKSIKPVWKITPSHCRFAAYVLGDGRIHSPGVLFYNSDEMLLEDFETISKKCFGIKPSRSKRGSVTACEIVSKPLAYFLKAVFDFRTESGRSSSETHVLPPVLFTLPREHRDAFIAAFFDCEAHITPLPSIEVMTKSQELATGLSYLFLGYGLQTKIKEKMCSATNSPVPKKRKYYRLTFFGFAARKLLKELPLISKKLILTTKKENTNYDVIPIDGKQIVKLRKTFFLSQNYFDKVIYLYEQNKRNPSRSGFRRIIKKLRERQRKLSLLVRIICGLEQKCSGDREKWALMLKNALKENRIPIRSLWGKSMSKKPSVKKLREISEFFIGRLKKPLEFDLKKLERISNKEVFFDRIKSIEKLKEKRAVYDLTIDPLHTFIGGNGPIVLHNTAAVLCPAISYALKEKKTVFFLTSKISQHEIAVELIKLLNEKFDLGIRGVDLVGRKYLCSSSHIVDCESTSFYELCRKRRKNSECEAYANIVGFDELQRKKARKRRAKISNELNGILSHLELKEYASNSLGVVCCGYETSMLLAKDANVVVADYFHLFDAGIRRIVLQRMKLKLEDCIIVVDEAHNLPERIRSLLSSSLSVYSIGKASEELVKIEQQGFIEPLEELKQEIVRLAKENLSVKQSEALVQVNSLKEVLESVDPDDLLSEELRELGAEYMEKFPHGRFFLGSIANFLDRWKIVADSNIRIIKTKGKMPALQVKALDASPETAPIFRECHSAILMSGTLLPVKMYADLLGIEEKRAEFREFLSPFPKENKLSLIVPTVTTKYTSRSTEEYERIAEVISKIVGKVPGNTAVFFPSFALLEAISPLIEESSGRKFLKQKSGMSSRERTKMLSSFRAHGKAFGAVLLAVSAGSFAEGIDFLGDQLLGAIIVGVPLGEMDLETQCLVSYYKKKFGEGWHYGYIYPAMTRAIQASGRVIRDESDKGVVAFLDKRYTWPTYRKCFPKDFELIETTEPEKLVEEFWNSKT